MLPYFFALNLIDQSSQLFPKSRSWTFDTMLNSCRLLMTRSNVAFMIFILMNSLLNKKSKVGIYPTLLGNHFFFRREISDLF